MLFRSVLLTDGWSHIFRKKAAVKFKFAFEEMEHRHSLLFELFETGKISFDEYLTRVIFYQKRTFTRAQFKRFIFEQSKPHPKMLRLMRALKDKYGLKIFALSNEARDLNAYRIKTFNLKELFDAFISSCYVHVRKPDVEIFQLALDVSGADIQKVLYIENTPLFVELAQQMGIQSILHKDYPSTCQKLKAFGLVL